MGGSRIKEDTKMALEDYKRDMDMCIRCSVCKFIPMEMIKGYQHVNVCPSITRYHFHTYSGGGRINVAVAMLDGRLGYSDKLLEIIYNCQMCGACDISCKNVMDMEVIEPINELRIKCIEDGHTLPILDGAISHLRTQDTMMAEEKAKRGKWAETVDVKDITKERPAVIYHAGCRTCYDEAMWKAARAAVLLLKEGGVDIGIAREHELCCGGRAYQMGYKEDFLRQARRNMEQFRGSGARTLVTGCSDCYHAFKVLYDKYGMKGDLEVLHATEYLDRLMRAGKVKATLELPMRVSYHDPCHLGRLGEPYIHWEGREIPGHIRIFDPPKEYRRGTHGVYEPPRNILRNIPGLKLVEMDRTKEYAWCCGAGGGVDITNPGFARWTARERVSEAETTGAEAIVTACPGCVQNFRDAIKESRSALRVFDVVELLDKASPKGGY
jgi:Fe-S oxidoreductase